MSSTIIIDNEYATLQYHFDKKIVHHKWKQWIPSKHFREVLTKGAEAFEKYGAQKWLSDDRGNGALLPEDAEWATTTWSPRVMEANWKYWAIVMPEKVIGQMNMKQFIKMYSEMGVTVQTFTDPDEAMTWLESQ